MSKLYKINEQYAIYRDNESTLFAVSEDGGIILDDKVYSDIVNFLLFKHASLEQIIYNFLLVHPPAVLLRAFKHLCSSKVICPVDSNSELSISENISKLMSEKFKPIFKSLNAIELDQEYSIRSMLEQQSFKLSDLANLSVVVVNDYLDLRLDKINQKFRKKKKKWLLFKPFGKQIMVGPIFSPADNNFCWECLAYRLKMHRPFTYLQDNVKRIIQWPKPIMTELSLNVAIDLLQQRLIDLDYKGITGYSTILSLNLTTGQLDSYQVYKRPQCSKCGIAQKVNYSSLQINAKSPVNDYGGGYRSVSPQKTYLKYQHLVSPVTGIIPNIIEYSQSESALIHNYSSGRNLALQSKSLFWLNNHLRSCNGGKGKSKWQAKTGALCEAIERYSMIYHGQQPCKSSTSFVELGDTAIHPNRCMNFSESQFVNREAINQQCSAFYSLVPVKFDPHHRVDWTSVYSLVDHTIKYLPSAFCYAQYPHDDEKALIAYPDSNGCASGNTHAEAILQGTFELIERDAAAIWWYNKIPRAEVDLQCIGNDYITSIIQFYKSKGRALYVLDITTDFNIPTFVAISYKLSNGKEIIYGFGCHLSAEIALERSIIELNQLLPILLDNKLDKVNCYLKDWLYQQQVSSHYYLVPHTANKINLFNNYSSDHPKTIASAADKIITTFAKAGIDLLVLDLTQPDIGMPVVKMIAPGLRHFWRRTGPGRLYTVPVEMKWLHNATTENELNPYNIVI